MKMRQTEEQLRMHLAAVKREFLVENWPDRLQRASRIERRLQAMMPVFDYQLGIVVDDQGEKRIRIQTRSPSTLPSGILHFAKKHERDLIAWVEQTERIQTTIRRIEGELCQRRTSEAISETNDSAPG